MSIKVMTYVWEHSRHKGSELLTLLAIADHADDNGTAYPSIARLAEKTRMTERNTQFVLRKLELSQELAIQRNGGPHGKHLFQIVLNKGEKISGEKISGVKRFRGENQRQNPNLLQPQISPESSLREPSVKEEPDPLPGEAAPPAVQTPMDKTASPPRPTKLVRSHFVPEDFVVTAAMVAWAALHVPGVPLDAETAFFRDHEFRDAHSDWSKAWHNWMRREYKALHKAGHVRASPDNRISEKGWRSVEAAKRIIEEVNHGNQRYPALP